MSPKTKDVQFDLTREQKETDLSIALDHLADIYSGDRQVVAVTFRVDATVDGDAVIKITGEDDRDRLRN
jgi:hypothetical protein